MAQYAVLQERTAQKVSFERSLSIALKDYMSYIYRIKVKVELHDKLCIFAPFDFRGKKASS